MSGVKNVDVSSSLIVITDYKFKPTPNAHAHTHSIAEDASKVTHQILSFV